jgi:hypothetical protein
MFFGMDNANLKSVFYNKNMSRMLKYSCVGLLALVLLSFNSKGFPKKKELPNNGIELQYNFSLLDYNKLSYVKQNLKDSRFSSEYKELISSADKALEAGVFSVVNKTQTPPSGDKHDYITYGPYWWPDPEKLNGLPWIRKDGEINPLTREGNTDFETKAHMFSNTKALAWAYFFSDNQVYANKAIELLKVWFLNEETKMNSNLNFAQGIPGINTGRGIGIIEFAGITNIINAIEILEIKNALDTNSSKALRKWLSNYLNWLQTSENGVFERDTKNNHGTYYDVQVVSIQLFLNKKEEAVKVLETAKKKRIASQIEPDGKQPHELARTKSLSYSTMNLSGMTQLAYLGAKVDVDLWNYEAQDGASIQKAYEFLKPYATGEKKWKNKQITSLNKAQKKLKETFLFAGSLFNNQAYCQIGNDKTQSLFHFCN